MGLFDTLFGKDYHGQQSEDIRNALGPYEKQLPGLFGGSNAALLKAIKGIKAGYGQAREGLAGQQAWASKGIREMGQQAGAQNVQSTIGRGLYGSTALEAGERGVMSDTNRALGALAAQMGQAQSALDLGEAQDTANIYGQMSSSKLGQAGLLSSLGLGKASLMGSIQSGKQGGILGDIIKAAAAAVSGG